MDGVLHPFGGGGLRLLDASRVHQDGRLVRSRSSPLIFSALPRSWVVQLLLPTFLQQLVYEKEKRLRMMMKMHGLGDGAYWLITYLWYMILYIIYMVRQKKCLATQKE